MNSSNNENDIFELDVEFNSVIATIQELLTTRAKLTELGVLRSSRPIIVDYSEWLVAKIYNLNLSESSVQKAYDATDNEGKTYQIKARLVTSLDENTSFDFSSKEKFDYLTGLFLNRDTYRPLASFKVPYKLVSDHWKDNTNSFRLRWNKVLKSKVQLTHF